MAKKAKKKKEPDHEVEPGIDWVLMAEDSIKPEEYDAVAS